MLENKVTELLGQLAEKLGVASEKVWEWAMLQVKVDLVRDIVVLLLAIAITFGFFKYLSWVGKNRHDFSSSKEFWHNGCLGIFGTLGGIFDIGAFFCLTEIPKLLINPEYVAFQNIISQLSLLK